MKSEILLICLGVALMCGSQTLHAQQNDADSKKVAELRAKAENGDARAQCEYGHILIAGKLGVAKDEAEAVEWIRKAADQNDAKAQHLLGYCYASSLAAC